MESPASALKQTRSLDKKRTEWTDHNWTYFVLNAKRKTAVSNELSTSHRDTVTYICATM